MLLHSQLAEKHILDIFTTYLNEFLPVYRVCFPNSIYEYFQKLYTIELRCVHNILISF